MSKNQTSRTVANSSMLNRRSAARLMAAAPFAAGTLLNPPTSIAGQTSATERDPLLRGMQSVVVSTDSGFVEARSLEVGVSEDPSAQVRLDFALFELFNIMDANKHLVLEGTFPDVVLGQAIVPVGGDLEAYASKLVEASDEEVAIPVWHHPLDAIGPGLVTMGTFDPRKGADLVFIDGPGMFDIAWNQSNIQIWGFTPWLTNDLRLRLGIYVEAAFVDREHAFRTDDDFIDMGHTLSAYVDLGFMALTYGNNEWNLGFTDPYLDRFFLQNPQDTPFPTLASLLSGKPEEGGAYWSPPAGEFVFHVDEVTS